MKIQNEILDIDKNKKQTENKKDQTTINIDTTYKNESKTVQTHHENFFKQIKSGISRPTKIEMPPIQEIDMSVLIELPEDIRNEILNEYAKKNEDKMDININKNNDSSNSKSISTETKYDEQNISYSQVDPEFLAALSEDLRRDVQSYCTAKKAEKCLKLKKNETNINGLTNENIKHNKKVENNSKSKNGGKSGKTVSKNKKKNVQTMFKTIKDVNEFKNVSDNKTNVGITKFTTVCIEKTESVNDQITTDEEADTILSHNRTILEDNDNTNQHQNILIEVVKRLLNLPLKQVKLQIQKWIANSKVVNEIDFLSIATFLSMLPEKKRIEDLHILLKTMHRCMTKTGNCIWHGTYRKIVKYVQHYMQIEYNSNLMVPPIKCNLLQCNSDVM